MRGIVLSLTAVSGLGLALLGGRVIAGGRSGPAQPTTATAPSTSTASTGPVYYGGTLAPIVVVATATAKTAQAASQCIQAGG